jgi:lysophospholipase L1-like esterase
VPGLALTPTLSIVLLGDSILDNGAYVGGNPDVVTHLRSLVPSAWRASLLAVDGATTRGLAAQLARVPSDATHLVVAVGGNDALGHRDLLTTPVASTAEALALFATRVGGFEADYRRAVAPVFARGLPVVLCTVYNGNLPGRREAELARVALALFNDVIVRVALEHDAALIDLRLVCTDPSDYANPIEPSTKGGRKIAEAIVGACASRPVRPS